MTTTTADWDKIADQDRATVLREITPLVDGDANLPGNLFADYDKSYAYKRIAAARLNLPLPDVFFEQVETYADHVGADTSTNTQLVYENIYYGTIEPVIERLAWQLMVEDVNAAKLHA